MGTEDSIELGFPPGSLAIDADSNILYILEENKQRVHRYSLSDEELLGRLQLTEGKPSGITFAWSHLWVMDSLEKRIGKYSVEGVRKGSIEVSPKIVGDPRGLASSADHLWGASDAGWSSKIFRINPESGRLDNGFFCECEPIDLASDGIDAAPPQRTLLEAPIDIENQVNRARGEPGED